MAAKVFEGRVVQGLGKGREFLSLRPYLEEIEELAGFRPFPGTLNVALEGGEMPHELANLPGMKVKGFVHEGRPYFPVFLIKARVNGFSPAAVVVPEKTEHANVVEIIAPLNLREELGLRQGSRVKVELLMG